LKKGDVQHGAAEAIRERGAGQSEVLSESAYQFSATSRQKARNPSRERQDQSKSKGKSEGEDIRVTFDRGKINEVKK